MDRRAFLAGMASLMSAPAWAGLASRTAGEAVHLAAAWQASHGYQVGILEYAHGLSVSTYLDVPSRAHGLLAEPGGTLLTVARRPGDWLLRWDRQGRALAWRWIEPGRAFAGHVLASANGRTVYTTEMDLDSGAGLVGVRDAATLAKRDEWPTHGIDPHELTWDATRPCSLIVANGGVPTRPETGRLKLDLERIDSSLVRLDGKTGERLDQWRLADSRLSLRHLAWNGDRLGIALQAEHDEAEMKSKAPILAVLDKDVLRPIPGPELAGYGGSIASLGDGFVVSCPRAQGVAVFDAVGFRSLVALAEACPLSHVGGRLWAGGRGEVLAVAGDVSTHEAGRVPGIRLDNHWIAI